jgi:hypothetical protein
MGLAHYVISLCGLGLVSMGLNLVCYAGINHKDNSTDRIKETLSNIESDPKWKFLTFGVYLSYRRELKRRKEEESSIGDLYKDQGLDVVSEE